MYKIPLLTIPALDMAQGKVRLPGSKSISNRTLLLAALCQGKTKIHGLLDSDDTRVMLTALRTLGCTIEFLTETTVCVQGIAGRAKSAKGEVQKLFLGNAGTAMRPLVAALALMPGSYELRGVSRMHERPIADLVDALRGFGCNIHYLESTGFPPLRLEHTPSSVLAKPTERVTRVRGDVSSQFLTALLLALPLVAQTQDRVIEVEGELISKPYIEITLNLLAQFGIAVQRHGWQRFVIPAGSQYQSPKEINIEPDASSASYFIALGALASEQGIVIEGLGLNSIQGDIRFIEAAQAMGAKVEAQANSLRIARGQWPLKAIDLDCNHIPDAAMTLAVMALFARGSTRLRNIASWRVKETDRLSAMKTELCKLGASVEEGEDFLSITPPPSHGWQSARIQTYDDHRMAMCFALAAFNPQHLPVHIEDPQCVAKTFPDYFETLFALSQSRSEHIPVITVDGPSASGKGTLATSLAQTLGFHYLDSGALYRLTALWALRSGVALDDEAGLARLAKTLPARFAFPCVYLNEEEVSATLREETIGKAASSIAALPQVRLALIELQRGFRQIPGLVCDGRDMGSVIFPDASLKIYLVADAHSRAKRRFMQIVEQGGTAIMENLVADLELRDARDQSRDVAPLSVAKGAILLDNSHLSVQESLQNVLDQWYAQISCRQPTTATKRDVGDGV